ncbi:SIR2 family protein [Mucilaginibacter sp. X4EP1]|uniref:SIR2 family protein n=1 Tax=Mucilaginibacter sp. X4EP1 TaxID=2723092 RepID=UPI002166FD11|nr:SIR2 family protein [Mucilaginibacter sp. X4EP1]MCS3811448.1 hypothetical protein [Mucilaginibacter sp. X4EP1]
MFQDDLGKHLLGFNTSPFLFVGSGLSRRYVDLETWSSLLEKIGDKIGLSKPFKYYQSNANNDLPTAASIMGEEFNETWWTSDEFEKSRNAYAAEVKTKYSPFKFEICKYVKENQRHKKNLFDDEIDLLKKINIDGIITTNWDTLLEGFFPDFAKFIGQEELIFSELFAIGEIYKIHGCCTKPDSLVLTRDDYDLFHERNTYLAAKLLTIFMEHPIIFVGYSLDDINIQQILKSIIKCLKKENIDKLKDRLIFCQYASEPTATTMMDSTILISDTVIPIKLINIHDYKELFMVMASNRKKLPVKVLRQMKGMIYEFVKSTDPKSKVFVTDNLENLENELNVEFVYGVGLKERFGDIGIKGINSIDVFSDAIIDKNWDAEKICRMYLATAPGRYLPYFKHLYKAGFLDKSGRLPENNMVKEFSPAFIKRINLIEVSSFYPSSYLKKKDEINNKFSSFSELCTECSLLHVLVYTPMLDAEKINLDELAAYLNDNLQELNVLKHKTDFRKLICLYDYLKFKYPFIVTKPV